MNEYDRLKGSSVYQLRTLARDVGVHAPTTKTVDILIKEIIDIKTGKLKPQKSKMGRPPKNQNNLIKIFDNAETKSISGLGYEPIVDNSNFVLESDNDVNGISGALYNFFGVVREQNSQLYVKNYNDNFEYVILSDTDNKVEKGDIVFGKATAFKQKFGKSVECCKFEGKKVSDFDHKMCVKICKDVPAMYDYIKSQNGNNFIVEVEASKKLFTLPNNNLYFYTEECEDVINSYNMLLDVKNAVKKLVSEKKKFTLYFVDVEYIYSILTMYYNFKKEAPDINAGQYFKEILCCIKDCDFASVVLFEKENGLRSSYLDIILNKYCAIKK